MHQLPFPISTNKVKEPFQLVHADFWGPAPSVSLNGFRFYLVLVDEFTKFTWVYLLKHKSDTFVVFKQFRILIQTQFKHFILIVGESLHPLNLIPFVPIKAAFTNLVVHTPHNRMVW